MKIQFSHNERVENVGWEVGGNEEEEDGGERGNTKGEEQVGHR